MSMLCRKPYTIPLVRSQLWQIGIILELISEKNIFPENTSDLGDGLTSSLKSNATYHSKHPGSCQWFPFKLL